jgi:HSP20 family protein
MLTRFNPRDLWAVAPLRGLQDEIDRFFNDCRSEVPGMRCSIDVREDEGHFYVDADVPGFSKEEIDITLEDNVLTIQGEKNVEKETKDKEGYHIHERRAGSFSRKVQLPSTADQNKVQAALKDGVLTVTVDKREELKPRKIEVKV